MDQSKLLDATCRVAFAAYQHDLGKFAERARLPVEDARREHHEQMYCPRREEGGRTWYTHKHAAYTALAWDLIERAFPELVGEDVFPFAGWGETDVDDSIVETMFARGKAADGHGRGAAFLLAAAFSGAAG
jgi:CRISPR-associated protein Csm1